MSDASFAAPPDSKRCIDSAMQAYSEDGIAVKLVCSWNQHPLDTIVSNRDLVILEKPDEGHGSSREKRAASSPIWFVGRCQDYVPRRLLLIDSFPRTRAVTEFGRCLSALFGSEARHLQIPAIAGEQRPGVRVYTRISSWNGRRLEDHWPAGPRTKVIRISS